MTAQVKRPARVAVPTEFRMTKQQMAKIAFLIFNIGGILANFGSYGVNSFLESKKAPSSRTVTVEELDRKTDSLEKQLAETNQKVDKLTDNFDRLFRLLIPSRNKIESRDQGK